MLVGMKGWDRNVGILIGFLLPFVLLGTASPMSDVTFWSLVTFHWKNFVSEFHVVWISHKLIIGFVCLSNVCSSVCPSVNCSHFHLLLQNPWANFNQTWHKVSLGEGIQVYSNERPCPSKRGDNWEIIKMIDNF